MILSIIKQNNGQFKQKLFTEDNLKVAKMMDFVAS